MRAKSRSGATAGEKFRTLLPVEAAQFPFATASNAQAAPLPPGEVAKQAGLRFDWQARRYQQQAGNYSMEELVSLHDRIAEADRALKSGAPGDVVMPTLIAAIAAA